MIRKEAGLTQKSLAEMLFVSQQSVWKWEQNESSPNPETIVKLAEIFSVSADYLLGRTKHKNLPPTKIDEEQVNEILIQRLMSLTPEEQSKVDAFVQGLIASRANGAFPPE